MTNNKFKPGFSARVHLYSALSAFGSIIFGVIMSSGLFIFIGFIVLLVCYLSLRKEINKQTIIRTTTSTEDYTEVYENGNLVAKLDHK